MFESVDADFPILRRLERDQLVYLDSANTSQKPQRVIRALEDHYALHNANIARAMHQLGLEATAAYEGARASVAEFIGAANAREVVFTKNASEALNLAAQTLALRWFDVTDEGRLDLSNMAGLINGATKIVSIAWVSNVTGVINPVRKIADAAHKVGATVVLDGAQGVPHLATDVAELGADMLAFTGHKMLGPTGVGVLWGRYDLLCELPPFLGGGEMIEIVKMEHSTYAPPPARFEAGTPPIAQAVGLGAAIEYLNEVSMADITEHDCQLTKLALEGLAEVPGLRVLGPTDLTDRGSAWSFTIEDIHPHDVMQLLDSRGISVRGGHHCARPLHERLGIQSSTRASGYLYNTPADIDALVSGLQYTVKFFRGDHAS